MPKAHQSMAFASQRVNPRSTILTWHVLSIRIFSSLRSQQNLAQVEPNSILVPVQPTLGAEDLIEVRVGGNLLDINIDTYFTVDKFDPDISQSSQS